MSKEQVLALLQGQTAYISGQEMSSRLCISRSAVWKAVQALRRAGYEIDAVTNRGYRLVSAAPTPEAIRPLLRRNSLFQELICLSEVDSTSSYLKRLAASGARHGTAVFAESQTGGRGRMGRQFASRPGRGIYLSVLLRPEIPPPAATALTSLSAVAVCRALAEAAQFQAGIKWVNDIVAGDRKLCGILTELAVGAETGQVDYVVIGIGVNVGQSPDEFDVAIRDRAVSLSMLTERPVSRLHLAAALLNALDDMYARCFHDPGPYLEEYRARCTTLGRDIYVIRGDTHRPAHAVAIEDDFSLLVRYPDGGLERLRYGEISVRTADAARGDGP